MYFYRIASINSYPFKILRFSGNHENVSRTLWIVFVMHRYQMTAASPVCCHHSFPVWNRFTLEKKINNNILNLMHIVFNKNTCNILFSIFNYFINCVEVKIHAKSKWKWSEIFKDVEVLREKYSSISLVNFP